MDSFIKSDNISKNDEVKSDSQEIVDTQEEENFIRDVDNVSEDNGANSASEESDDNQNDEKDINDNDEGDVQNKPEDDSNGDDSNDDNPNGDNPDDDNANEDDSNEDDSEEEEQPWESGVFDIETLKANYKNHHYLRFGSDKNLDFISTSGALSYLLGCGFGNSGLKQARHKITEAEIRHNKYEVNEEGIHYCDFCGRKLGAEYDILNDGRERCYECSKTVVENVDELRKIFVEVIKNMEALFGISYFASIDIQTVSAKKIAKKIGINFVPTPQYDGRVLGFAANVNGTYQVCLENQSPYLCAVSTMAHELTHIWQYLNWKDERRFKKKYYPVLKKLFNDVDPRKVLYEGMAKWVEIQYLFLINEHERAMIEAYTTLQRNDEYGYGFRLYLTEYELTEGTFLEGPTPFYDKDTPLHDI